MEDVWDYLNGVKVHLQETCFEYTQYYFYNGQTHDYYVNRLCLFAPNGYIVGIVYNTTGRFHDSAMTEYGMYRSMDKVQEDYGGKVVIDSEFQMSDACYLINCHNKT